MRVLAPASVIGTYDGVELFLLSIELWPSGMVVHAACLESELTKRLDEGPRRGDEGVGRGPPAPPPTGRASAPSAAPGANGARSG